MIPTTYGDTPTMGQFPYSVHFTQPTYGDETMATTYTIADLEAIADANDNHLDNEEINTGTFHARRREILDAMQAITDGKPEEATLSF